MRPLDSLGSIKLKLGVVIVAAVVVTTAFFGARFLRTFAPRNPAGTGSSLGSRRDMLVRNFFTPCSSNCTRVYASSTAMTDPSP